MSAFVAFAGPAFVALVGFGTFIPKDAQIGDPTVSYVAADFSSSQSAMTYLGAGNSIRFSPLHGVTGAPAAPTTPDLTFDTNASPLRDAQTGPRFGLSRGGSAIYYTKPNGVQPQIWRAVIAHNVISSAPVTAGDVPHTGVRPSLNDDGDPAWLLSYHATRLTNTNSVGWLREDDPNSEQTVNNVVLDASGPQWISGTHSFTYLTKAGFWTQVAVMDAETGLSTMITDDEGNKSDAFFIHAPEWGGESVMICTLQQQELAVYRHFGNDPTYTQVLSVPLPFGATTLGYQYMYAFKPFTWDGHTYLVGQVQKDQTLDPVGNTTASAWIIGLDSTYRRVDAGEPAAQRYNAQVFFARTKAYAYYSLINSAGRYENHRCETGFNHGDANVDGRVSLVDIMYVLSQFGLTTPGLAGDLNRDSIVDENDLYAVLSNFAVY